MKMCSGFYTRIEYMYCLSIITVENTYWNQYMAPTTVNTVFKRA